MGVSSHLGVTGPPWDSEFLVQVGPVHLPVWSVPLPRLGPVGSTWSYRALS